MLHIKALPLGIYQTNCYFVHADDSETCVVIDPGSDPDAVMEYAESIGKTIEAILLTHGHFDHVGAVKAIAADTDCKVFLCADELQMPEQITAGRLYYTDTYDEGSVLNLAGTTFHVLHTPGHTPGSVCLMCEDVIFSGDTLFAGSRGRTDMPCGSTSDILKSLSRLSALPGDFTVYPGHGGATRLSHERQANPFL